MALPEEEEGRAAASARRMTSGRACSTPTLPARWYLVSSAAEDSCAPMKACRHPGTSCTILPPRVPHPRAATRSTKHSSAQCLWGALNTLLSVFSYGMLVACHLHTFKRLIRLSFCVYLCVFVFVLCCVCVQISPVEQLGKPSWY